MKRISAMLLSVFLFWCVSETALVTGVEIGADKVIVSSVEQKQIPVAVQDPGRGTWIEKYFNTWESGKHNKIKCIECHSVPPAEKSSLEPKFKELGELYTYMSTFTNHSTVRKQLSANDLSCTSSKCHPSTGIGKEGEYWTKKLDYAQYERADKSKGLVQFTHDKHYDPKKQIEGHPLHCTSCHQHETEKKHFEVAIEKCFLCHFKNTEFNIDRAKCSLCHEIPTKPLQSQKKEAKPDEKPVTHKSMEEAKVGCQSCHLELIKGKGQVSREKCFNCHDKVEAIMMKVGNKKLMHQEHVAKQAAACFNCHQPIEHKDRDFIDAGRETCTACHPDHHAYQEILLLGERRENIQETPGLMMSVKTNCLGCHLEERTVKGEKVAHGSAKACAACHTEKHEGMAKQWMDQVKEELESALDIEKEAEQAIKDAEGKVSMEKLNEAKGMLQKGQENLRLVEYGGGVHNQKYSVMLLDEAMNNLEDLIDLLNE
jgi:hypothetical protein